MVRLGKVLTSKFSQFICCCCNLLALFSNGVAIRSIVVSAREIIHDDWWPREISFRTVLFLSHMFDECLTSFCFYIMINLSFAHCWHTKCWMLLMQVHLPVHDIVFDSNPSFEWDSSHDPETGHNRLLQISLTA